MQNSLPHVCSFVLFVLTGSCTNNTAKREAGQVVRIVTDLRSADNAAKRVPLDRLRSYSCTSKAVCEARDACVKAFDHHVKGIELGQRLRRRLDGGLDVVADPAAAWLLEMNVEVEAGRAAMPECEQRVASLRIKHKL